MAEVWVCSSGELRPGEVKTAHLDHDEHGLPVVALVLRDGRGRPRAYRNLCRHLPIPLDGGTGRLLSEDNAHLVCGTHGATYRISDGYCVDGPCEGLSLAALGCRERNGEIYVSTDSAEAPSPKPP